MHGPPVFSPTDSCGGLTPTQPAMQSENTRSGVQPVAIEMKMSLLGRLTFTGSTESAIFGSGGGWLLLSTVSKPRLMESHGRRKSHGSI